MSTDIRYNSVKKVVDSKYEKRKPYSKYIIVINNSYVSGYSSLCSNKKHAKQYLGKEIMYCDIVSIIDMYGAECIYNIETIEVDWE